MPEFNGETSKFEVDVGRLTYMNAYRYQKKAIIAEVQKSLSFDGPETAAGLAGD